MEQKILANCRTVKKTDKASSLLIFFFLFVAFFTGAVFGASIATSMIYNKAKKAGVGEWYIDDDSARAWRWLPATKEKK